MQKFDVAAAHSWKCLNKFQVLVRHLEKKNWGEKSSELVFHCLKKTHQYSLDLETDIEDGCIPFCSRGIKPTTTPIQRGQMLHFHLH